MAIGGFRSPGERRREDWPRARPERRRWPGRRPSRRPTISRGLRPACLARSEEHTSELQSLMRISYAVFCLKKKKHATEKTNDHRNKYKIPKTILSMNTRQT